MPTSCEANPNSFDVDGVFVGTAALDAAPCAESFAAALAPMTQRQPATEPLVEDPECRRFVDGRRLDDEVRDVLAARGLRLSESQTADPPDQPGVGGLADPVVVYLRLLQRALPRSVR